MNVNQKSKANMMLSTLKILKITSEGMMKVDFPCHDVLNDMLAQVFVLLERSKTFFDALADQYVKESTCDADELAIMSNQLDSAIEQLRKTADEHGYNLTDR